MSRDILFIVSDSNYLVNRVMVFKCTYNEVLAKLNNKNFQDVDKDVEAFAEIIKSGDEWPEEDEFVETIEARFEATRLQGDILKGEFQVVIFLYD